VSYGLFYGNLFKAVCEPSVSDMRIAKQQRADVTGSTLIYAKWSQCSRRRRPKFEATADCNKPADDTMGSC